MVGPRYFAKSKAITTQPSRYHDVESVKNTHVDSGFLEVPDEPILEVVLTPFSFIRVVSVKYAFWMLNGRGRDGKQRTGGKRT